MQMLNDMQTYRAVQYVSITLGTGYTGWNWHCMMHRDGAEQAP